MKYLEGEELTIEEDQGCNPQGLLSPTRSFRSLCGTVIPQQGRSAAAGRYCRLYAGSDRHPGHQGCKPRDRTRRRTVRLPMTRRSPLWRSRSLPTRSLASLTFFRVYSGTVDRWFLRTTTATKDQRERLGRILQMHANHRQDIDCVYAGDIAAGIGLKNTTTGDTLCDEKHPIILESMEFPDPVIRVAIEPKTKAGQEKMGIALAKLAEEDPTFKTYTDEETGQTIIAGMGELHLEIIVDRLLREFKVEANVGTPQVAYKETIRQLR